VVRVSTSGRRRNMKVFSIEVQNIISGAMEEWRRRNRIRRKRRRKRRIKKRRRRKREGE
jgi:hypothetical protein